MRSTNVRAAIRVGLSGLAVLGLGTFGYWWIEGVSLFDALYMTTITVTTIGFKEAFPLSAVGRVFTIVLAFFGIGFILLAASQSARAIVSTDLRRLIGTRRDLGMIKRLSDHIVVCGYGRMGRGVVEVLRSRKVSFVVVESDLNVVAELEEERVSVIHGDATQKKVLQAARIERAKTFIACLREDADNVFAILLARQLHPDVTIIARAGERESEERLRLAGAHKVTNPYRLGGMRLAFTALKPNVMDFVEASLPGTSDELELAEIVVHPSSELAGKTLAGADVRRRFGVIVVALKHGEESVFNPGPDALMQAGDVLVTLGPIGALEEVERASV